jgi:hypothetical protein
MKDRCISFNGMRWKRMGRNEKWEERSRRVQEREDGKVGENGRGNRR